MKRYIKSSSVSWDDKDVKICSDILIDELGLTKKSRYTYVFKGDDSDTGSYYGKGGPYTVTVTILPLSCQMQGLFHDDFESERKDEEFVYTGYDIYYTFIHLVNWLDWVGFDSSVCWDIIHRFEDK